MSIDANIVGIAMLPSGEARLTLEQPDRSRCAGRDTLIVEKPLPRNLHWLMRRPIWGGSETVMCGEVKIGKRVGYCAVQLDADAIDRTTFSKVTRCQPS